MRSGGITSTSLNYTGQRRDDTGLLYYNARYYDPSIGRFISADTVVPGNASGGMDGVALRPLTVGFGEPEFVNRLNQENQFGPWHTLSDDERQQVGSPWGPSNPQSLNRYSYVQNNPLRWTDPSGHCGGGDCTVGGALIGGEVGGPVGAALGAAAGATADVLVILGLGYVGGKWLSDLGSTHSYIQGKPITGLKTKLESRWRDRDSDVGPVRVRKLKDSEVRGNLHNTKNKRGMGATDNYYVDADGNVYSGREDGGELTLQEANHE